MWIEWMENEGREGVHYIAEEKCGPMIETRNRRGDSGGWEHRLCDAGAVRLCGWLQQVMRTASIHSNTTNCDPGDAPWNSDVNGEDWKVK